MIRSVDRWRVAAPPCRSYRVEEAMTKLEAEDRARQLWGGTFTMDPEPGGGWSFVRRPGDVEHRLDAHGHVACRHPECLRLERFIGGPPMFQLRKRYQTSLGRPAVLELWRGDVHVGYLTAGSDGLGLAITAEGYAVSVDHTRTRALKILIHGPDGPD